LNKSESVCLKLRVNPTWSCAVGIVYRHPGSTQIDGFIEDLSNCFTEDGFIEDLSNCFTELCKNNETLFVLGDTV